MNLLVISELFWPEGSGGTLAVYLTTKLLAKYANLDITVVTGSKNPVIIKGIKYIIDPTLTASNRMALWLRLSNPLVIRRFEKLMQHFDIIYIPYCFPLIPLAKRLKKKTVTHLHDYQSVIFNSTIMYGQKDNFVSDLKAEVVYELLEHSDRMKMLGSFFSMPTSLLCRTWVSEADTIICVSKRQAALVQDRLPGVKHKLKVVYNPLPDIPLIKKKTNGPTLIYIGGDSYVKGFHVFLKASYEFLQLQSNARFLLSRDYKNSQYKQVIENLNKNFSGAYRLLGHLKHESLLNLHSTSHALLFPSIWEEPLPYAIVESMLCGTIPIASRVGGIPEIVQGTYVEKMLFEPGVAEESVDRIETVLSLSDESLIDIGASLRENIQKRFNTSLLCSQFLDVFS
ncbi:MAG: glycosyltransferase family 4 protein [Candidatus Bathyarchaeia archaeon]|jgi:glycosyltransferase involved in cell wall biosynthesis